MFHSVGSIAVVQYSPDDKDIWKNLDTIKLLASQASLRGATVIVFPELCLSPSWFNDKESAADFSQTSTGYQTQFIQNVADSTIATIVFGYVELGSDNEFYNSAAVVKPEFGLCANVRKHNLSGFDHMWAKENDDLFPIVTFENCRMGIMIGDDVRNKFNETYTFLQDPPQKFYHPGSTDLICVLDSRHYESINFPYFEWHNLSKTLNTNVAISNKIGYDITTEYGGGSCVIDRDSRIWSQGGSFDEVAIVGGALS